MPPENVSKPRSHPPPPATSLLRNQPVAPTESLLGPLNVSGVDSGWSAMAKIVRDIDEEKVKDYKEDIDTFLVFVGLFSAVMTAFLIESYQNLQQDPQDVMVSLLQQLVLQTHSYSFNAGYVNSTTPLSLPSQTFEPTINAIRANVLWFTSLVLSLVSASFGILVKQWLREYLSGEYTSPQARLRIRRFRNPGLADWKVFEIAAILPLLLQLALALFFVGLCFFTADVHNSIGHTTITLVAGWGFLFVTASLAPALSPRCPYKSTLLKAATKWMRKRLYKVITAFRKIMRYPDVKLPAENTWSYKILAYDEERAAVDQKHDMEILISVDAIQSDERLLGVMWEALQQAQVDPPDAVKFLFRIIGNRLGRRVEPSPTSFLDLKPLSKSTCTSIVDMAADLLHRELRQRSSTGISKDTIEWSLWMKECLYLLFSEGPSVLTPRAEALLIYCFSIGEYRVVYDLVKPRMAHTSCPSLSALQRLRTPFLGMNGVPMLVAVQDIVQSAFCAHHGHPTLLDCIRSHPEMPSAVTQFVVDLHVSRFANYFGASVFCFFQWQWTFIECAIEFPGSVWDRSNNTVNLLRKILMSTFSYVYYRYAASLENLPDGAVKTSPRMQETAQKLLMDIFIGSNMKEREAILARLTAEIGYQWRTHPEENDDPFGRLVRSDPLQFCYIQLRLFQIMQERDEVPGQYLQTYLPGFWNTVYDSLRLVAGRSYAGHAQLAERCLELIDTLEPCSDAREFSVWAQTFDPRGSAFPDELVDILLTFIPDGDRATLPARARRAQLQKAEEPREEEEGTVADDEGAVGTDISVSTKPLT